MRAAVLSMALLLYAAPAFSNARLTVLMDVLHVDEAVDILRDEGFESARSLERDMLGGDGGALWNAQIEQIYEPEPIVARLREALTLEMTAADIDIAIDYFGSSQGQRIVTLENAARRALADPAVEEAAQEVYQDRAAADDPRVAIVKAFMDANELLERNVSGAMRAQFLFLKGLSDGGYAERTEAEILNSVRSQEADIRRETEYWLKAYLLMAQQPLATELATDYVDFARTEAGQALNRALFDGFGGVYEDVSYALGRAVALHAVEDEI